MTNNLGDTKEIGSLIPVVDRLTVEEEGQGMCILLKERGMHDLL